MGWRLAFYAHLTMGSLLPFTATCSPGICLFLQQQLCHLHVASGPVSFFHLSVLPDAGLSLVDVISVPCDDAQIQCVSLTKWQRAGI